MFARLRQPDGILGTLSLASALLLATLGVLGMVSLVIAAVAGSEFWSDERDQQLLSAMLFALMAAGAVGFLIMDQRPWFGAALAVVGGLFMTLTLFWAILPLVLGPGVAVVAVLRARTFRVGTASTSGRALA